MRIVISLVIIGQITTLSLSVNMTPPIFGTFEYCLTHLVLFLSTLSIIRLLVGSFPSIGRNFYKKRKPGIELMFFITCVGALVGSSISTITGETAVYYEVVSIVLVIYSVNKFLYNRMYRLVYTKLKEINEKFNTICVKDCNKKYDKKSIDLLKLSDRAWVSSGSSISIDGIILKGNCYIQERNITGNVFSLYKQFGDFVFAGTYIVDGNIFIKPIKLSGSRKLDYANCSLGNYFNKTSKMQCQSNTAMKIFIPIVLSISIISLIYWTIYIDWHLAVFNSMSILLSACPCALGIATPISIMNGLSGISNLGIITSSGVIIDGLFSIDTVVFDKTGTLSYFNLKVESFNIFTKCDIEKDWLIQAVLFIESTQNNPISNALMTLKLKNNKFFTAIAINEIELIPGSGIRGSFFINNKYKYYFTIGGLVSTPKCTKDVFRKLSNAYLRSTRKIIYLSINNYAAAYIRLEENFLLNICLLFDELKLLNIQTVVLTGDSIKSSFLGTNVPTYSNLTPGEKIHHINRMNELGYKILYIGDGANDAPAMSRCIISIAMGYKDSASLAKSIATAVLAEKSLFSVIKGIKIARRVRNRIYVSVVFAVIYNSIAITISALGILNPVIATLLMTISSITVTTYSLRSL